MSKMNERKKDTKSTKNLAKMRLKPIPYDEELSHFSIIDGMDYRDCMYTTLILDDYGWMDYRLKTFFDSNDYGDLNILFFHSGGVTSDMFVLQDMGLEKYAHRVEYDTEIFQRNIKVFMKKHMEQWDEPYAFNGLEIAVVFYNDVLEHYTKYLIRECSPDDEMNDDLMMWSDFHCWKRLK